MSRYSTRDRDRVESNPEAKIYVGELSSAVTKQDLDDTFSYYGPIRTLWVARNPPGFAFIEFEDPRDAEDAVRDTEGRRHYCRRKVCGKPVRIELSNKNYRGKRGSSSSRCYNCDERGHFSKDCRKRRSAPHRSHPREKSRSRSRSRHSPSYTRGGRKDDRSDRSTSGDRKKPKRHRSPSNSPPPKRRRSSSEGVKYKRKKKSHSSSSFESR